jgi:hypothetical protein
MNKWFRNLSFVVVMLATLFMAAGVRAQDKKNAKGESFFIVASVDRARSQILLKRPTEVTIMMKVDGKTQYVDENGKPIQLADLQTGATVWVIAPAGQEPTASHIRKGPMTVEALHQIYLDYPAIK